MFVILRILIIGGLVWLAIRFVKYALQKGHQRLACPNCDGKGYWYSVREREFCKTCNGTGKRPK